MAHSRLALLRRALLICALVALAVLVWQLRHDLFEMINQLDPFYLCLSVVAALLSNGVLAEVFHRDLRHFGQVVDRPSSFRLFFFGQIAKYLPGKIWALVYQQSHVRNATIVLRANYTLTIFSVLGSVILSALLLLVVGRWAYFLALIASVFFATFVYRKLSEYVLAKLNSEGRLSAFIGALFSVDNFTGHLPWMFAFVCLNGFAFVLAMKAFSYPLAQSLVMALSYTFAWLTGALAFVFPSGAGVREVVFVWSHQLGSVQVPVNELFSVAILLRLWQIICDLLGSLLIWTGNLVAQRR